MRGQSSQTCNWLKNRSSGGGSCSVLIKKVPLTPYLSMASAMSTTSFVESSMEWTTTALALLRYFVLPTNRTALVCAAGSAPEIVTTAIAPASKKRVERSQFMHAPLSGDVSQEEGRMGEFQTGEREKG